MILDVPQTGTPTTSAPFSHPPHNIAETLAARARECPEAIAVIDRTQSRSTRKGERVGIVVSTFAELETLASRAAVRWRALGIGRGTKTVVMVPPGRRLFATLFGLFKLGAVPVLIDPGMGVRSLGRCLSEARPQAFLGVPRAQWARRLLGWARDSIRITATVGRTVEPHQAPFDFESVSPVAVNEQDLAAILFTSGSTGPPKGVEYTHGQFQAQLELVRKALGIEPGQVELATFPLFALFGPALGMTLVLPRMDYTRPARVDPEEILDALRRHQAVSMFASPALLRRVATSWLAQGTRPPTSLKRIATAGAPIAPAILEEFDRLIAPDAVILTPYGATEALPVAVLDHRTILSETRGGTERGRGVCVGSPIPGVTVDVIAVSHDPIAVWSDSLRLPQGQVGEIVVAGPTVTRAYHNNDEATRLAKIADPSATGGVRHRMGDLGYFDEQGRLWFQGRKAQRLVTAQGPRDTAPVEGVACSHPGVARAALVGIPGTTRLELVVWIEPKPSIRPRDWPTLTREVAGLLAERLPETPIDRVWALKRFPVDIRHNAKIGYEELTARAARRRGDRVSFEDERDLRTRAIGVQGINRTE